VIDLHSHILPGIDDGPETLAGSLEIARAAVADGIRVVAATPHVRDDYPTSAATMERGVEELRDALRESMIPLDLRPGGEIAIDWLERLPVEGLRRFGLGGNPDYILVEFPYYGFPLSLAGVAFDLSAHGITPVIAHPERNADVQASPEKLRPIVRSGALVQVTAASLDGRLGPSSQDAALELIERELAHLLASDAHHATIREVGMAAAMKAVGNRELGRWLADSVPQAILDGAPLPPRPEKRRWFRPRSR
jgi:protein-tyrosine phosphatase